MKKLFMFSTMMIMALFLATGCSEDKEKDTDKVDGNKTDAKEEVNVQAEILEFYLTIPTLVNAKDGDLNAYEVADPATVTPEMKQSASASAAAVAEELKGITVPETLADQKADLEAARDSLSESYQIKADELKKDGEPNYEAADAAFTKANDTLTKVFEANDLNKPDLAKEVN